MYIKFILIKPKMRRYSLFISFECGLEKRAQNQQLHLNLSEFFYSILVIYTTIIYKVLCINHIDKVVFPDCKL